MNKNKLLSKLALSISLVIFSMTGGCCFAQTTNPPPVIVQEPGNAVYVTTNGNDATAIRGRSDFPFSSLSNAAYSARSGDKIIIGSGNFTNIAGTLIATAAIGQKQLEISGLGTNATFIWNGELGPGLSNYVHDFTWTSSTNVPIAVLVPGSGLFKNLVLSSPRLVLGGGTPLGYSLWTNCVFITSSNGISLLGTHFFYNCALVKPSNTSASGSIMLQQSSGSSSTSNTLYWSGGSISILTNSTDAASNNVAVFQFTGGDSTKAIYLQNATVTTPTGALDISNGGDKTIYTNNVTFDDVSKTNGVLKIASFSGFPNTNGIVAFWNPLWPSGTTNVPLVFTNVFWIQ